MEFKDGLTAAVALAVVWLGHRFTTQRSVADRLWDMRRSTYGFILAKLLSMSRIAGRIDVFVAQHGWDRRSDTLTKNDDDLWEQYREIQSRFVDDYLIVSPAFRELFTEFSNSGDVSYDGDPEDYDHELHNSLAVRIRKFRPRLNQLALEELEDLRRGAIERMWHRIWTRKRPLVDPPL